MASVQADGGYFGTTLPSGQTGDNTLDSLRKRGLIPIDPYIDWQVENLETFSSRQKSYFLSQLLRR
jgi:hypothetical protein